MSFSEDVGRRFWVEGMYGSFLVLLDDVQYA
jgi:hypothetical protein